MIKTIESESPKAELLDIQRWEDEGGQMNERNDSMADRLLVQPVPVNTGKHDRSMQWNGQFVIEPCQPGNGILLTDATHLSAGSSKLTRRRLPENRGASRYSA